MTIKIKMRELIASNQSLLALGSMPDLPGGVDIKVARVIRKSRDEVRAFNDARMKVLRASGKAKPHPQVPGDLWIDPADLSTIEEADAIDARMRELSETDVELETGTIKLAEFGDAARKKLTPIVLADLDWLIATE